MAEVDLFDDSEVVMHMMHDFQSLEQGVGAEDFIGNMKDLHEQWVMCRCGRMSEPKEKWRYLVATFQKEASRIKECKEGEIEALEEKRRKAREELQELERKVQLFHSAQAREQGETNFKVYQGLLPGEAYESLRAKMQEAFLEKVKAVLSQ